jgi:hypothetical protein
MYCILMDILRKEKPGELTHRSIEKSLQTRGFYPYHGQGKYLTASLLYDQTVYYVHPETTL